MINFFLEARSQMVYAEGWMPPVVKNIAEQAPASAKPYAGVKLLGTSRPDEREEMMTLARKIYSNY